MLIAKWFCSEHAIWAICYGVSGLMDSGRVTRLGVIAYAAYDIPNRICSDRKPIFAVSRFLTMKTRAATASKLDPKIINC